MRLFGRAPRNEELDEWARHHDDPRSSSGFAIFVQAMGGDLSVNELHKLWEDANRLVGKRAPADYGEFLAYGYLQGRLDAIQRFPKSGA